MQRLKYLKSIISINDMSYIGSGHVLFEWPLLYKKMRSIKDCIYQTEIKKVRGWILGSIALDIDIWHHTRIYDKNIQQSFLIVDSICYLTDQKPNVAVLYPTSYGMKQIYASSMLQVSSIYTSMKINDFSTLIQSPTYFLLTLSKIVQKTSAFYLIQKYFLFF